MLFLVALLLSATFLFLSTDNVHAIIVVIPAVLIPIVSTVVWIIGAITTPVIALSIWYFKFKKKSSVLGFLAGVMILVLLGVIITAIIKLISPQRPIY
ncbi:MAG: hypothetical protein AAB778_01930 [Patescibacteria group bacterium]